MQKNPSVEQANLSAYQLLPLEDGHCLRDQALDLCKLHGIEEQDFKAASLETLRQMVRANTGITLIPKVAVEDRKREAVIRYINFSDDAPKREIGIFFRKTTNRRELIVALGKMFKQVT